MRSASAALLFSAPTLSAWVISKRNLLALEAIPVSLLLTTVTSICLIMAFGRGTGRYMNGSKLTETKLHTEQTTVFLNWPCNEHGLYANPPRSINSSQYYLKGP